MTIKELEVKDRQGKAYSLRIRSYKNLENKIDGAVIALFDADTALQEEQRSSETLDVIEGVMEAVEEPMAILSDTLRVERANPAFCRVAGLRARPPACAPSSGTRPGGRGTADGASSRTA